MDPKYLNLEDLLSRKLFRIPAYQRTYSWQAGQRKDLFDDIRKLSATSDSGRKHFMATIACLGGRPVVKLARTEFEDLDVVDGQQRLTSLIILLKCVELRLKALPEGADGHALDVTESAAHLERILVKPGKEKEVLLQANHDNSHFFRKFLQDGTIPPADKLVTAADGNLRSACLESVKFIEEYDRGDVGRTLDLSGLLRFRLTFVFYELEDEATVYRVFETLNSRGLPVDPLDKCKSVLLGIAAEKGTGGSDSDPVKELLKTWGSIYRLIGLDEVSGEEALRFAATLWRTEEISRPPSAAESIEIFRKAGLEGGIPALQETSQLIADVIQELRGFLGQPGMTAVTEIAHARLLAVAIRLSNLPESEKGLALEQWERMTFRIFGIYRRDARTKVGDYTRAACKIYRGTVSGAVTRALATVGGDFPASGIGAALSTKDCYSGWERELRYFMYRYEEHLSEGAVSTALWKTIWAASPDKTIEHVFPQNPSAAWTPRYEKKTEEGLISRLGNLVVLSQAANSSAGNQSFAEKKARYLKEGAAGLRLVAELLDHETWGQEEIDTREKTLIEWAASRWADIAVDPEPLERS